MRLQNQMTLASCMTALIMACGANSARAQADPSLLDRIKKLEARIAELEGKTNAAPAVKPALLEASLGATKFSGYASGSYPFNFKPPPGLAPNSPSEQDYTRGRCFCGNRNQF